MYWRKVVNKLTCYIFLQGLGQEYSVYTYDMLNAGIDRDTLMSINEEQLLCDCGIKNKIHLLKILQGDVFFAIFDIRVFFSRIIDAANVDQRRCFKNTD